MRIKTTPLVIFALLSFGVGGVTPIRADDTSTGTDWGSAGGVILYDFLQNDANRDPKHTLFTVDAIEIQATASITGTLNRVAQYQPLDSGVKISNMFYQKELKRDLITMQLMYAGGNAYRLDASMVRPDRFKVHVNDTSVFHRVEADPGGIDINRNPGAVYSRTWQRTQVDADYSLTKDGQVGVYGGGSWQHLTGAEQHSFFQLHRFNCTDCHTEGFMQMIDQHTQDYWAGLRAHSHGVVADVGVGASNFESSAPLQSYNFGGPIGVSYLYPTPNSTDSRQDAQLYAGEGNLRVGGHYENTDRVNQNTGQTLTASHLSLEGAYNLSHNLSITGMWYTQQDNNSVLTSLSDNFNYGWIQAAWRPKRDLNLTARIGQQEKNYSLFGQFIPTAQDQYLEVRGDYRHKRFYAYGKFRNDSVDHPYFSTDFASRSEVLGEVVYTAPKYVVGGRYDNWYGSNTANDTWYTDFLVYASTPIKGKIVLNVTYDVNNVSANNMFGYYFTAPVYPALGSNFALFDQLGFPYTGQTSTLMCSATIPIGKKRPWRLTPSYSQINTSTFGGYLVNFPGLAQNTAVGIQQSVYGLRVDIPLKSKTDRLGVGWENDNWSDAFHPGNGGSFNLFNLYLTRRY